MGLGGQLHNRVEVVVGKFKVYSAQKLLEARTLRCRPHVSWGHLGASLGPLTAVGFRD